MNVIIVSKSGVLDTPFLVKNDITAEATFDSILEDFVEKKILTEFDFKEIIKMTFIDYSEKLNKANSFLNFYGIEIFWFIDVKVNKYKN